MIKKILLGVVVVVLLLAVGGGIGMAKYFGIIMVSYDETPPVLPEALPRPAVLVFSKAAGFVHTDALPAAKKMLSDIAAAKGWGFFETDNGAVMTPELLKHFDVVIWNNTSGTTLNVEQREAFRSYVETGGGFVGIHAAGGDPYYRWKWYVDELIGAQFIGHTMSPHFQEADILVVAPEVKTVNHLGSVWKMPAEEWYGFEAGVRHKGYQVLLTMDESTYDPNNSGMDGEHPITWQHAQGEGRSFYTAIGHQAATYSIPAFKEMISKAIAWAGALEE